MVGTDEVASGKADDDFSEAEEDGFSVPSGRGSSFLLLLLAGFLGAEVGVGLDSTRVGGGKV